MNRDKLFDYLGVEKSEGISPIPADGEVKTLNRQSGDQKISVMSCENARDKRNSSRAFR
jgi:hypothetical protein